MTLLKTQHHFVRSIPGIPWTFLSLCLIGSIALSMTPILTSCSLGKKKDPPIIATKNSFDEFNRIEKMASKGRYKRALRALHKFLAQHKNSDLTDNVHVLMGKIYYKKEKYKRAFQSFLAVANSEYFSPEEDFSRLWAAKSLYRLGQYDESLSLIDPILKEERASKEVLLSTHKLRYILLNYLGDNFEVLRSIVYIVNNGNDDEKRKSFESRAIEIVESRLTEDDLSSIVDDSEFDFVRPFAIFRVASFSFEKRDYWKAERHFKQVIELAPNSDISERSLHFIAQIRARRVVHPKTIGVILPLSGKRSKIAYKTLHGLQLGLGIFGNNQSRFKLAVIDSEGNPDAARRGVERLVTEDHVIAIVGSLLSKTAAAVASKANELRVPNLTFSQRSGLTEIGEYVFQNAVPSESQIHQLVETAMVTKNLKTFAILYPNDKYGVEYANLFWDEVLARGGEITGAQPYNPNETDFRGAIQRLVGTYYLEDRKDEYKLLLTNWVKNQTSLRRRNHPPDDILPPVVDFDALFIPDSIKITGQIAPMLAYHDVNDLTLLGTSIWNSPAFPRRGQKYVERAVFLDGLLLDRKYKESEFYKHFTRTFNEPPRQLEIFAYDAGLMLRQIIISGQTTRDGVMEKLKNLRKFKGAIGSVSVNSRREIERPLVKLTVKEGRIVKL